MLVVCPSCSRHVRTSEAACPFCAKAIPAGLVPVPHGPRRQYVGKNATALALASALAASGCSGDAAVVTPADVGAEAVVDSSAPDAAADTSADTADSTASDVRDEGGPVPIYK
jgi:hypothetical protein